MSGNYGRSGCNGAGAETPSFRDSTGGILSLFPSCIVPYLELTRVHKPAGYWAFYLPHLFGTLFAAVITSPRPNAIFAASGYLLPGTFLLRGAACTWNDVCDRDYDRQVARCRNRPIARGAVSRAQGLVFMAVQTAVGVVLFLLPLPGACLVPAGMLAGSQMIYPLCKRFTYYPQVWLGFSFGFGLAVGSASLGVDLVEMAVRSLWTTTNNRRTLVSAICLYMAIALNTLIYDTIYGHQDLKDDPRAGVKSIAVAWRRRTKPNCLLLIIFETGLLYLTGSISGLGTGFHILAVGGTGLVMVALVYRVDLESPKSCMQCFNCMITITGMTISAGLLSSYAELEL
ncbi:MAG: hypothetical protein M1820_010188 [Bogoriella megaspora]|nr:MAG: hypothetical protein M1820_010188 [Bogoriella megaspora]